MRKKYIIGNWKMHKTTRDAKTFVVDLETSVPQTYFEKYVIGVCPSFLALNAAKKSASKLLICAQDVHYETKGAYTGEVSYLMLKELGINTSLVGHSERRIYFNETNASCNLKLKILFENKMMAIYCVGETLKEYEENKTKEIITKQIEEGLKDIQEEDLEYLVIAYEPVWSIGSGKSASSEIAKEVNILIREVLTSLYNSELSKRVSILYGGSVNKNNVNEYLGCEEIDGVLVGGASLEVESFMTLITNLK